MRNASVATRSARRASQHILRTVVRSRTRRLLPLMSRRELQSFMIERRTHYPLTKLSGSRFDWIKLGAPNCDIERDEQKLLQSALEDALWNVGSIMRIDI